MGNSLDELPRVLVTGGCGFVGRHFVNELVNRGHEVTVVDDLSTGLEPGKWPTHLRPDRPFAFKHGDVRQELANFGSDFDLVIHLAAVVGGRMTIEGDPLKVATDLAIDATFFNWLSKLAVAPKVVLNFSSSAAYPIHLQTRENRCLLTESMINFDSDGLGIPDMTYGWSKLTAEFLAQYCVNNYGINVVSFRPFSGYGEDQDLSYPFPRIVKRVIDREDPFVVWGSGDQERDFIHIDDIVQIALTSMLSLEPGAAMNLSSGEGISFFELAKRCQEIAGVELELKNDPTKPEGVFYRVGSTALRSQFANPTISLEEGIRRTFDYLQT
jgi:UDP-glucose 4-epimerase